MGPVPRVSWSLSVLRAVASNSCQTVVMHLACLFRLKWHKQTGPFDFAGGLRSWVTQRMISAVAQTTWSKTAISTDKRAQQWVAHMSGPPAIISRSAGKGQAYPRKQTTFWPSQVGGGSGQRPGCRAARARRRDDSTTLPISSPLIHRSLWCGSISAFLLAPVVRNSFRGWIGFCE